MITIEQMVQREINCCLSSLVSTLAGGYGDLGDLNKDFRNLCEQAFELASPVLDYEEAAMQAEWRVEKDGNGHLIFVARSKPDAGLISGADPEDATGWEDLCHKEHLDPYEREIFEHWSVSQWLADKLQTQGERVDTYFAGLNVWARTTTGQAISMDGVIQNIYKAMTVPAYAEELERSIAFQEAGME